LFELQCWSFHESAPMVIRRIPFPYNTVRTVNNTYFTSSSWFVSTAFLVVSGLWVSISTC
jgi:hypothetical protein